MNNILNEYLQWFKNNFVYQENEIITPFTDNHNDLIHFRIEDIDGSIYLTDDGYTLSNLSISGFSFTESREYLFNSILEINGTLLDENDCLKMKIDNGKIGCQVNNYINAIKEIDNLIILSQQNVRNFFRDDVEHFFSEKEIPFIRNIRRKGKSGLEHSFDFQIEKSDTSPERIIRVLGTTDTKNVQSLLFSWNDINLRNDFQMITFLNDRNHKINDKLINAFTQYNVIPIEWKKREQALSILSA